MNRATDVLWRFAERVSPDGAGRRAAIHHSTPPEPWPGPHLLLSPHPDDIALSIGGLVLLGLLNQPTALLTLFGQSNYLENEGFSDNTAAVTRIRRNEETEAAERLGVALSYHELPEASLRECPHGNRIFAENAAEPCEAPEDFDRHLGDALDVRTYRTLWAPLGLGCHRDHLLVQRAARRIATTTDIQVFYYEDLPYAGQMSERSIRKHIREVSGDLIARYIDIRPVLEAKLALLEVYRSQLVGKHIRLTRDHAHRWGNDTAIERIWVRS